MKKRIIALCLICASVLFIFAGCAGKDSKEGATEASGYSVAVTDKDGQPVTDKDGKTVTQKAQGTDSDNKSPSGQDTTKIPYSTTAPGSTISNSTWPFGSWDKVGIVLPEGWERVGDTYNYVRKKGTSFEVVANPKNILGKEYKTAAQYAEFERKTMKQNSESYKELGYIKEVYSSASAAQLTAKVKDSEGSRYIRVYIFQNGDDILVFNCYCNDKSEIDTSIEDVIANTCYRG